MDRMSDIKRMAERSKLYSKIQTKKTINPVRVIEPSTPADEEQDQYEGEQQQWKLNFRNGLGRSSPINNFKRGRDVTSSVRYNPKVRDLGGDKDNI
jgi:hypothetical protein